MPSRCGYVTRYSDWEPGATYEHMHHSQVLRRVVCVRVDRPNQCVILRDGDREFAVHNDKFRDRFRKYQPTKGTP